MRAAVNAHGVRPLRRGRPGERRVSTFAGTPSAGTELGRGGDRRCVSGGGKGRFPLRGRRATACPAPGLVPDGSIRHPSEAELRQRADVVALQAHQRDEHFIALAVEDGGRTATARLGFSADWSKRGARTRVHRRGDLVEHDGRADEQADLTPPDAEPLSPGPPYPTPTARSAPPSPSGAPSFPREVRPGAAPAGPGRPPGRRGG